MGEAPPESLADARVMLDRAMEAENGVRITFESRAHALRFRHRLYAMRKRDREQAKKAYEVGDPRGERSPYDCLAFFVGVLDGDTLTVGSSDSTVWTLTITRSETPYGALKVEDL